MVRNGRVWLCGAALLLGIGPAPASPKPCRDKDGKIVDCAKPARKPSPRCKDDKGRFVACEKEAEQKPPRRP